MKCPPQILSLFAIHHWTALANKNGRHGTEGESLDIKCSYPDGHQNLPKYFCCEPCRDKDILVKVKKSDSYTSSGRFSLYDNSQGRSFTVTIRKLRLQDAGIYYCGIDKWDKDKDKLEKVRVTVGRVKAPVTAPSISSPGTVPTATDQPPSHSTCTSGSVLSDQDMTTTTNSTPHLDGKTGQDDRRTVVARVFAVLVCSLLTGLAALLRRRSVSQSLGQDDRRTGVARVFAVLVCSLLTSLADLLRRRSVSQSLALKPSGTTASVDFVQDEEDPEHVYDEIMEYSAIGCHRDVNSMVQYCTVQFSDLPPEADENALYSVVKAT